MTENTTTAQTTDEQLQALAIERLDLTTEIKARQERIAQIDEVLLQHITAPRTDLVPGYKVRVQAGAHRLNTKKLETDFPAGQFPGLYQLKLDTVAIKEHFAPAALAAYQTQNAPSVRIDEVK